MQLRQPDEFLPGPSVEGDEALRDAAARIGTTIFHPLGTAKMGVDGDSMRWSTKEYGDAASSACASPTPL